MDTRNYTASSLAAMDSIDFSASRCYSLKLPNTSSSDPRLRLDVRTGAALLIYGSRIFAYGGLTVPIHLSAEFTTDDILAQVNQLDNLPEDRNDLLSGECFELSLIQHRWRHLTEKQQQQQKPVPRMSCAIIAFDNYLYMHGGLRFSTTDPNKMEVLNDVWRLDVLERKWECIFPLGGSDVERRFDHRLIMLPTFTMIGRPNNYGFIVCGGLNEDNKVYTCMSTCDLTTTTWDHQTNAPMMVVVPTGEEVRTPGTVENAEITPEHVPQAYRGSRNTFTMQAINGFPKALVVYDSSSDLSKEPLVYYSTAMGGERPPLSQAAAEEDLKNVPRALTFPHIQMFGENFFVAGYEQETKLMAVFIHNMRSHKWMRLQIKCFHQDFSHRLCRGFVWESHHEMLFLGGSKCDRTYSRAAQFFDLYLFVPLAFTSTFGIESKIHVESNHDTVSRETHASESAGAAGVAVPAPAPAMGRSSSVDSNISLPFIAPTKSHEESSFDAYSRLIAPQLQVSSIPGIFPASAVALSQNAFERSNAFSDFEFIAADGLVVPVPLVLCRRRWGSKFDRLLTEAYAWSFTEQNSPGVLDVLQGTNKTNTTTTRNSSRSRSSSVRPGSFSSSMGNMSLSNLHGGGNSAPSSRRGSATGGGSIASKPIQGQRSGDSVPFFRYPFQSKAFGQPSQSPSPVYDSRRSSLSMSQLPPGTPGGTPRHGSRGSLLQAASPRQNSAASIERQSSSRQNSVGRLPDLSSRRSSMFSRSSTGLSDQQQNQLQQQHMLQQQQSPTAVPVPAPSPSPAPSSAPAPAPAPVTARTPIAFAEEDIPPQMPMPTISDRDRSGVVDKSLSTLQNPKEMSIATEVERDPLDASPPPFDTPLPKEKHNTEGTPPPSSGAPSGISSYMSLEQNIKFPEPEESAIDMGKVPRVACIPYSGATVKAFVEYLYSGQIGTNWKLFPTAVELMLLAKRYDVPLLYNLVMEMMFVILARKEARLQRDANKLKADVYENGLEIDEEWFGPASVIGRFSQCLSSLDDGVTDMVLLKQSSKVGKKKRRRLAPPTDREEDVDPLDSSADNKKVTEAEKLDSRANADAGADGFETESDPEADADAEADYDGPEINKLRTTIGLLSDQGYVTDEGTEAWPTFKSLVSTGSPACSDTVVQMLIEVGALVTDMKLMLRAINVKEMSRQMRKRRQEVDVQLTEQKIRGLKV